jgi:hypothetical protein
MVWWYGAMVLTCEKQQAEALRFGRDVSPYEDIVSHLCHPKEVFSYKTRMKVTD